MEAYRHRSDVDSDYLRDVCPETLAGSQVTLRVDGDGEPYCDRCGAPLAVVKATGAMVQAEWTAGGAGYRKPRVGERSVH